MSSNRNTIQAKLVLLGDMGTGKTSLALRFVKGQYNDCQGSTIGAAFFTQVLSLKVATIKFDIWDTPGPERYHSLAPMYYRGRPQISGGFGCRTGLRAVEPCQVAVVVYDITNKHLFEGAKKWVQELQRRGNPNFVTVLVANKLDLNEERSVGNEEGELYAKENCLLFYEASAKTAQNVNEFFYEMAKSLAEAGPMSLAGIKLESALHER